MMMDIEQVRALCLALPQAEECTPFAKMGCDDIVYKVGGKMFALLCVDDSRKVALKCDEGYAIELRERYPCSIEPAFHFNKKYWNQVFYAHPAITSALLKSLIEHAHHEVVKKLTQKLRTQLKLPL